MIYVIMCGGIYNYPIPKQLWKINNEPIVQRTIRLLQECGVPKTSIYISSNDERFEKFGVPVIHHNNSFDYNNPNSYWLDAFPILETPVCYIFGDVVFSQHALQQIVNHKTDSIKFYASARPFDLRYPKIWAEPFAYKVVDTDRFVKCIKQAKQWQDEGRFNRMPVSWELWQVIQGTPINHIRTDYFVINDYTCDVDDKADLMKMEQIIMREEVLWQNT